jgi:hypothetical protein
MPPRLAVQRGCTWPEVASRRRQSTRSKVTREADAAAPVEPIPDLGPIQTALLHARVAKTAIPYEQIAYAYPEVAAASDEFVRRDRMAAVRERLDYVAKQLEHAERLVLHMRYTLPDYDFQRGGFTTGLADTSYVAWIGAATGMKGPPCAVLLTNGARFAFAPVEASTARHALQQDITREAVLDLEVEPVAADNEVVVPLEPTTRALSVRIHKVKLLARGVVLAEVDGDKSTAPTPASSGSP